MKKRQVVIVILLLFAILFIMFAFMRTIFSLIFLALWLILTVIASILIAIEILISEDEPPPEQSKILYIKAKKEKYTNDIKLSKNFKKVNNQYVEKDRRKYKRKKINFACNKYINMVK